ncbi:TPA: hypothetical protein ACOEBZ_001267 [Enterobacter ludwigii]
MNLKSKLWFFWGSMDVLAILLYSIYSFRKDRIPFISDIVAFSGLSNTVSGGGYGVLVTLFFTLDMLLLFSLFISSWLFFKRKIYSVKFALIQEVFRLISFRCSISLFPLLVSLFGVSSIWMNIGLFLVSEAIKIYTLIFVMRKIKA